MSTKLREKMLNALRIRRYSDSTIRVYIYHIEKLASFFQKKPEIITTDEINTYQEYLVNVKKCSWANFNQAVCSMRFLYRTTLKKDWDIAHIPFQRKKKRFLQFFPEKKSVYCLTMQNHFLILLP